MIPRKCAKAAAAVDTADIAAIEAAMKDGGNLRAAVEAAISERTVELNAYMTAARAQHPDAFAEPKAAPAEPVKAEAPDPIVREAEAHLEALGDAAKVTDETGKVIDLREQFQAKREAAQQARADRGIFETAAACFLGMLG